MNEEDQAILQNMLAFLPAIHGVFGGEVGAATGFKAAKSFDDNQ